MKVKVEVNRLKEYQKNNAKYLRELKSTQEAMIGVVEEMSTIWNDPSYVTFVQGYFYYIDEMANFAAQYESYNYFLLGYIGAVEALDDNYSSKKITIE